MAKYMPVAIRDETGAFIRQMAQGNEAMARMYAQLLARYHERLAAQEFRSGESATNRQHQWDMLSERERLYRERKAGDTAALPDNPLGRGANAHPRQQPPAAAPAPATTAPQAAPPPNVPPAYRGGGPNLGNQAPGSRGFTPQGSSSRNFSSLSDEAANSYAQAPQAWGADHTDFSAQSVTTGPQEPRPERGKVGTVRPSTAAPRDTQRLPSQPKKVQLAEFQPIRREWLDMMAAEEKKNGLPQGTLLTLYGMENGGGKYFGNDPSKAYGMFQFTKQLRDRYGISDQDAMNPAVMIPKTAENLRYNADKFSKLNMGQKLGNTAEWMPYWTALHQWGEGDGIRVVTAALRGSGHMYARDVMISKNADGSPRDRGAILKLNKLDPNVTIADTIKDQSTRGTGYHTAGLKIMGDPDAHGTTEDQPPRPPADVGSTTLQGTQRWPRVQGHVNIEKVVPAAVRAVNEVQALYPKIEVISGYRGQGHRLYRPGSQHSQPGMGTAIDLDLSKLSDAEKTDVMERLRQRGARGIGNYGGASVHADWRPGPIAAWGPDKSKESLPQTAPWFRRVAINHQRGVAPIVSDQTTASSKAVAAAPATTTTPPAAAPQVQAAAPEPFVPTPMEDTPQKASITAAMFGVKPSEAIANPSRRDAYFSSQPLDKQVGSGMQSRTSSLGPMRGAATASEFDSGPPKMTAPIMPPATGSEYDSRYSSPMAPMQPAAEGNEFDAGPPPPLGPIMPAAAGNEFDTGRPPLGPIQDAATANEFDTGAPRPAWEEPFDPPATSSLPMPDINPQSAAISEAQRMVEADAANAPAPRVPSDAGAIAMPDGGMPGTDVAPDMPAAPAAPPSAPMAEYNPFNTQARARRGALARQGASEIPGNVADIARAMFNTTAQGSSAESEALRGLPTGSGMQMPQMPTQLPQGVSDWLANPKFLPDRPNLDAAAGRIAGQVGDVASNAKKNAALFANAVQQWIATRRADTPKSVKTINPVAPDASSTKPKMHPNARMPQEQDEPLVLQPKPGTAAPPPFSSGVPLPQSGKPTATATPPMARKPGTMPGGTSTQPQGGPTNAPAGFTYQRVGPGQFIKVPIGDAGAAAEEQQQQELVVE